MPTNTTLTSIALLVLLAGGVALAPAAAAETEALCGQIRYLEDGTKVTIEVEGDRCVHDVKKDTCTCTSAE